MLQPPSEWVSHYCAQRRAAEIVLALSGAENLPAAFPSDHSRPVRDVDQDRSSTGLMESNSFLGGQAFDNARGESLLLV
jgi:hypothetical protein